MSDKSPEQVGIPFSFFCSLVRAISKIEPTLPETRRRLAAKQLGYPALHVFSKWVKELRRRFNPLPPRTTAICFRMLFSEEDIRRRYDIQEARMIHLLTQCFGIDNHVFDKLSLEEASGCLGQELRIVLERSTSHPDGFVSPLTITEVDELLDELASKSGYSHHSVRSKYPKDRSRSRAEIIQSLFRPLSPEDASVLSQIILKDLKPLMYPLSEFHYTIALTKFDSKSVKMLTKEHAMNVWDLSKNMLRFYYMQPCFEEAAAFADQPSSLRRDITPTMNSPVAIPKSEKGLGCRNALNFLEGSDRVWAETKYDGERAQIHVEMRPDNSPHITIFSKSKRDSTLDRYAVHGIIRRTLGLDASSPQREKGKLKPLQNVILDAEMVAFRGDKVDEFWRIRELIETTARGIRGNRRRPHVMVAQEQESMDSEANEDLTLGLVFFDVIYLDSVSLHARNYAYRRGILEALIQPEPGKAVLADRYMIDMSSEHPWKALQTIFSDHIACHQEGLVLKAEDSRYNDYGKPWVKLKKDYIPGYGDTLNLVVLGASWEKNRGRLLRVPPTTFTTFYVGALENQTTGIPAQFRAYFTVSYGLNREELEEINFLIKNSNPIPYPHLASVGLPYKLSVFKGLSPPSVILRTPLLVEVFGAGFTKAPKSQHYELRFPRIKKFYRPSERSWEQSTDLKQVHITACASVGRDRSDKDIYDWVNETWGKQASPSINCPGKRKERAEIWHWKLGKLEKMARYDISSSPFIIDLTKDSPSPKENPRQLLTSKTNLMKPASLENKGSSTVCPQAGMKQVSESLSVSSVSQQATPSLPLKSALAWFAPSAGKKCQNYALWKKRFPREERLHSLESLLVGCGWTAQGVEAGVAKKGIIIVDECNEDGEKWKEHIFNMLNKIPQRTGVMISVLGCRTTFS